MSLLAVLTLPATVHAQAYTPPPPPLTTAPCVPTKKVSCDSPVAPPPAQADTFAFPGEPGQAPAATASPANPQGDKFAFPGEPPASAPGTAPGSGAFPFPGEPAASSNPASSPSSSSSSSSSNPAEPSDATPRPLAHSTRRLLPRSEDPNAREAEDLQVSRFYIDTGDYIGAYNRAKDALRLYPGDPEAHYALAVAARKMKHAPEAIAEFQTYLKLDPDGRFVRQALYALDEISKATQK